MPPRTRKKALPEPVVLRDPAAIKALAHPARLAVLDQLMAGRELTATECADVAGLSPSAMSYHLRALAKWEIVVPVESADGRERRWRLRPGGFSLEPSQPQISGIAEAAVAARFLDRSRADALDWITHQADVPTPWEKAMVLTATFAWLTIEETTRLHEELRAVTDQFRGRTSDEHPVGAKRVQIGVLVVPERAALGDDNG